MILVLLGTQDAPFSRIITLVEQAVSQLAWQEKIIVQAGHTQYQATAMLEVVPFFSQSEFEQAITQADVVICHGGAGTMLTAMKYGKQIIACARKHEFAEHNNDHQSELVDKLANDGYLQAIQTQKQLEEALVKVQTGTFIPRKFDLINDVVNQVEQCIDELEI